MTADVMVITGPGTGVPTALYRLFNAKTKLIYVGVTDNLKARMGHHARKQPWWPEVARKTIEWYPNRAEAEAAETQVIEEEHPLYNIVGADNSQRIRRPNAPADIPAWSDISCRAIIQQVGAVMADRDSSHARARLRCMNILLTGKDELPRGYELEALARQCGVTAWCAIGDPGRNS